MTQSSGQLPPGTAFDLFRGTAPVRNDEEEAYPTEVCGGTLVVSHVCARTNALTMHGTDPTGRPEH